MNGMSNNKMGQNFHSVNVMFLLLAPSRKVNVRRFWNHSSKHSEELFNSMVLYTKLYIWFNVSALINSECNYLEHTQFALPMHIFSISSSLFLFALVTYISLSVSVSPKLGTEPKWSTWSRHDRRCPCPAENSSIPGTLSSLVIYNRHILNVLYHFHHF